MAEEKFRLPGSSYEELTKIIKAYAHCKGPVGPTDVGQRAAIDPTIVSRNNGFFLVIGVVQGGKKKELTAIGRSLAAALDHSQPEQIQATWREVIEENEFFQKIVSAVRIRKGMEPSSLRAHIAYSAGQPKSALTTTGAGAIIEILSAAGLICEDEGKFVCAQHGHLVDYLASMLPRNIEVSHTAPAAAACATLPVLSTSVYPEILNTTVQVQIQVQCSAADIENLGPKIKKLLDQIRNQPVEPCDQDQ